MTKPLSLNSVIGFAGQVPDGLLCLPDGATLVHALGSTIVLRDKDDPKMQEFLQGHTDKVDPPGESEALRRHLLWLPDGRSAALGAVQDRQATTTCAAAASSHPVMLILRCAGLLPGAVSQRALPGQRAGHLYGLHCRHHPVGPAEQAPAPPHEPAQGEWDALDGAAGSPGRTGIAAGGAQRVHGSQAAAAARSRGPRAAAATPARRSRCRRWTSPLTSPCWCR